MLVVNEEHNHTLGTKAHEPGSSCALCQESIYFPVIVGIDRNRTSYHPGCAVQVAQALLIPTCARWYNSEMRKFLSRRRGQWQG